MPFRHLDPLAPYLPRIVATVVVVVLALVVTRVGRRGIGRLVGDASRRYRGYKVLGRIAALVVAATLVFVWAPVRRDLLTVFTILGTATAFSTREALLSVVGWMHIAIRAPFRHGDRIEVNGIGGDVVDVRLLHTTLVEVGAWVDGRQSTGRLVHIPNSWVFLHGVVNATNSFGFVWDEFSIVVARGSDWKAAHEILEGLAAESSAAIEVRAREQLARLADDYLVHYRVLTPFVYVSTVAEGVRLTLRHLVEVRQRRGIDHALTVSLLDAVAAHGGIEIVG